MGGWWVGGRGGRSVASEEDRGEVFIILPIFLDLWHLHVLRWGPPRIKRLGTHGWVYISTGERWVDGREGGMMPLEEDWLKVEKRGFWGDGQIWKGGSKK
jgi:hypothetical protein